MSLPVAVFNQTTGWSGKTIIYEEAQRQFILQDHGPITAQGVLSYDAQGQIEWADEGLREWTQKAANQEATGAKQVASQVDRLARLDPASRKFHRALAEIRSQGAPALDALLAMVYAVPPFPANQMIWCAICEWGDEAVPRIVPLVQHENLSVSGHAVMALGTIAQANGPGKATCIRALEIAAANETTGLTCKFAVGFLEEFGVPGYHSAE